jgi:hypothetical protein
MSVDRFLKRRARALDHPGQMPAHLLACGDNVGGKNDFAAMGMSDSGRQLWRRDLAWRAHDVIADPTREICAIIGRKPGPEALICDLETGAYRQKLTPLPNCTFDGHGVFSADSRLLYTTQSEGKAQIGHVAVYDLAGGTIVHSYSSHGIEPHELLWAADGATLIIGNGGIVDRNATDAIQSGLVWLDAATGACRTRIVLDEDFETLSLRHLARLADGRIVCGVQDQDPATDLRPLVLIADASGEIQFLDLPRDIHRRLDGYIGSIAVDRGGTVICATSPRGGLAVFWSAGDGRYLGHVDLPDTCGVAGGVDTGEFLLTSGYGARLCVGVHAASGALGTLRPPVRDKLQWDNHMSLTYVD